MSQVKLAINKQADKMTGLKDTSVWWWGKKDKNQVLHDACDISKRDAPVTTPTGRINISRHRSDHWKGMFQDKCRHTWTGDNLETTRKARIDCALKELGAHHGRTDLKKKDLKVNDRQFF